MREDFDVEIFGLPVVVMVIRSDRMINTKSSINIKTVLETNSSFLRDRVGLYAAWL